MPKIHYNESKFSEPKYSENDMALILMRISDSLNYAREGKGGAVHRNITQMKREFQNMNFEKTSQKYVSDIEDSITILTK